MKKFILSLFFCFLVVSNSPAEAHRYCGSYYLTHKYYYQNELYFPGCDKHSMLEEKTIYYYSNGSRYVYTNYTVYNSDGSILITDCSRIKHIIHQNRHYFIVYKGKGYKIIDENGNILTGKNYKKMEEIAPNRLLVKFNKKYGVIDINENIIIPIKYKEFKQVGYDLYQTKLNGYWGLMNSSNYIFAKNKYDKIKPLQETFILKQEDKYGLANTQGQIIFDTELDKIKSLGEYILIKKDKKYGLLDSTGKEILPIEYKKIELERNSIKYQDFKKNTEFLDL